MKGQTGVWINSAMAIIVSVSDTEEAVDVVESHLEYQKRSTDIKTNKSPGGYEYITDRRKEEERIRLEKCHFFEAIKEKIEGCKILSIFGPDPTKQELKHFLEKCNSFCHKAISVQPLGQLPQEKFVWFVHKYYDQVWV
jgi:hypothetical protein